MNVALLVKDFPPDVIGGTEIQTCQMAAELSERDHEVTVITKSYGGGHKNDDDRCFEIKRIWNFQNNKFLSDLTFVLMATLYLLRNTARFDILQCMMVYPVGCVGYLINNFRGLPYFAWVRGNDFYRERRHPIKRRMMRAVFEDTVVLVQAPDVQRDVEEFFSARADSFSLRVVGNGVRIPPRTASPSGSREILYLGRLVEKKGVHNLIRAVSEIDRDHTLTIVGDGPESETLQMLARDLDVDVSFEGAVPPDQVNEYYENAGLFVLPSKVGEGLPNAVLEAMSWGLPVVATDSGGTSSAVVDEKTGFIVPMGEVDPLRERIEQLLQNPALRRDMGDAARKRVESQYSWESICTQVEEVYAAVGTAD